MVDGPAQGQHSGLAHPAVARLQPDHAADGGWHADRAAGIGAQGAGDHARRHGGAGAAAGTGRGAGQVPGVVGGTVVGRIGGRSEGELVGGGLAHQHRARLPQAHHRRGVGGGDVVSQDAGAGGGADARRLVEVFQGNGHAGQRPALAAGQGRVGGHRLRQGQVGRHRDEGVEGGLQPLQPLQSRLRQLHGAALPAAQQGGEVGEGAVGEGAVGRRHRMVNRRRCHRARGAQGAAVTAARKAPGDQRLPWRRSGRDRHRRMGGGEGRRRHQVLQTFGIDGGEGIEYAADALRQFRRQVGREAGLGQHVTGQHLHEVPAHRHGQSLPVRTIYFDRGTETLRHSQHPPCDFPPSWVH